MAQKRIRKQLHQIQKNPPQYCISAGPKVLESVFLWQIEFQGPPETPYQDGDFFMDVTFPQQYPFKPPKIAIITKIYHPNINSRGHISMGHCLSCGCSDKWSPAYTIIHIFKEVIQILKEPQPDDPLVPEIAKQYKQDRERYVETAKTWTQKYAN